ncbi:MAG: hypothetical protein Q4D61_09155, partial [Cardiobacteriaceae bacterium]|nr:hypothetical protein [Cardiobacteriaceae bacterium]
MYLLKLVSQQGQTLQQINLKSGNLQRIAAVDNVHYQLADAQSGLGAQGVQAGRAGNDLLVHIQGEPTLLIEDYFLLDDSGLKNPLLGMNGSGQYVAYPIADSAPVILEHQLAGELTTAGASASAPPAAVVAGIAGVALVGAAIAGGSKGSRSANDEAPQPQTPFDPNQPAPPTDNGNVNPPPGDG